MIPISFPNRPLIQPNLLDDVIGVLVDAERHEVRLRQLHQQVDRQGRVQALQEINIFTFSKRKLFLVFKRLFRNQ